MAEARAEPENVPPDSEVDTALRDLHDVVRYQADRVAEVQAALDAVRKELETSQRELEPVRLAAAARQRQLEAQTALLDDARRSIAELHRTRLFRWSVVPRRMYGWLRRALRVPGAA